MLFFQLVAVGTTRLQLRGDNVDMSEFAEIPFVGGDFRGRWRGSVMLTGVLAAISMNKSQRKRWKRKFVTLILLDSVSVASLGGILMRCLAKMLSVVEGWQNN
jgi:hypothetical protein